jgi:hypothetical protein
MQYFVVMIDYGRRGREAVVDPEMTWRDVISRIASGEYNNISFIHEIADRSVDDVTEAILAEAALRRRGIGNGFASQPSRSRQGFAQARDGATSRYQLLARNSPATALNDAIGGGHARVGRMVDGLAARWRIAPHCPGLASPLTMLSLWTQVRELFCPTGVFQQDNGPAR